MYSTRQLLKINRKSIYLALVDMATVRKDSDKLIEEICI